MLPWLILSLLVLVAAAEVHGFRAQHLFSQEIWSSAGQERLVRFGALFGAASLAVLILVPWLYLPLACGLAAAATLALLPPAGLATAYFLFSAWCLGDLAGRALSPGSAGGAARATLLGIALYLAPMPLVARLPVHYPAVWLVLLAIPIALRRPRRQWPRWTAPGGWAERAALALLVFVLAIHWFAMLQPEAGADGLAMHLAIPMDMARHHALTFEPARFVWAVMPMGGDFAYAIVYQLGGEHAARLLNLALLILLLALLRGAARRWASPGEAWLLAALFAATPLAGSVTGELFIENLLAGLLLAAFLAVGERAFLAAAILSGAALATKLGALPFVALLGIYAAWERPRRRTALAAAALVVAVAAPGYLIAWAKTGNPVFPFLNGRFHSALLPAGAEIRDERFRQPLAWRMPYDLTFRTELFYEGQRGSFGFQYLLLAPLAVAALLVVRRRSVAAASLVALGAAALVLRSDPNARYLYPELPLLAIPCAVMLGWSAACHRTLWRALIAFLAAAALLDVWFLPAAGYWHKDLWGPFTDAQRSACLERAAPIRAVIAWFERAHPGAPVLLASDTAIAGLSGEVYENQWHQYGTMERIRRAPEAGGLPALLAGWKVRYAIVGPKDPRAPLRPRALRELLGQCGAREFAAGGYALVRIDPGCTPAPETPPAPPSIVLGPGVHDDGERAIVYRGEWDHRGDFDGALGGTTSYTDEAGAEAAALFEGTAVEWIFARAPNRGTAEVTIDGVARGIFDLYAPAAQWRQQLRLAGLAPGSHTIVIRATGGHRAAATGSFIDVDAIEVR
ncbi:MAG: hypothetical protein JST11_04775 [Acidobacteria bacterium]|nr:hypothetical protein [Acidobacteriota bacterium]